MSREGHKRDAITKTCFEKCSVPHEKSALPTHGRALFDTCFTGKGYRLKQLRALVGKVDMRRKNLNPMSWLSLLQRIVGYELVEISGLSHIPLSTEFAWASYAQVELAARARGCF